MSFFSALAQNHFSRSSLLPDLRIKINRLPLAGQVLQDLIAVSVHEDVEVASMFTLELHNWDEAKQKVSWSDDKRFHEGNEVEIQMGYLGRLSTLMKGEITGLEPTFIRSGYTLMVRGYDRRHRLMRGRKSRSFSEMKDSMIAREIAYQAGLMAEVTDSGVTLDYVLQHNQTDWEFLQERARRIGYEVFVQGRTLYFRPHQNNKSSSMTLSLDTDIIEFTPRLTTMQQADEFMVRGWDFKEKKAIVGRSKTGDENSKMGGRTSGPKAAHSAFGKNSTATVKWPVGSLAEADHIAKGQFNEIALAYIRGEALCMGRNDLRAGLVVNIAGLGKRFSGDYYITSASHTIRQQEGYRTTLTVQRNAT